MSLEHSPARQKKNAPKTKRTRIQPQSIPLEPDCFYTGEQVAARYGTHRMTPWQWARDGKLPKPKKIGPNVSRWYGADLIAHEQSNG